MTNDIGQLVRQLDSDREAAAATERQLRLEETRDASWGGYIAAVRGAIATIASGGAHSHTALVQLRAFAGRLELTPEESAGHVFAAGVLEANTKEAELLREALAETPSVEKLTGEISREIAKFKRLYAEHVSVMKRLIGDRETRREQEARLRKMDTENKEADRMLENSAEGLRYAAGRGSAALRGKSP